MHIYGDVKKLQDELGQRMAEEDAVEAELESIWMEKRARGFGIEEDDPLAAVADVSPSPPTRSPMTYASLLPAVGLRPTLRDLADIVETVARADERGTHRRMMLSMESGEGIMQMRDKGALDRLRDVSRGDSRRLMLAGTDTRGFRMAPDGGGGMAVPAGAEERDFHQSPDPEVTWSDYDRMRKRLNDVGTDVRRFWRPPDWVGRHRHEQSVRIGPDFVGTDVKRFLETTRSGKGGTCDGPWKSEGRCCRE